MLSVLLVLAVIGCIPGAIAQGRGHSFVAWWLFGAALFVVALPMALCLKPPARGDAAQRKCPACAEWVKVEAVVCKHCGRDLPEAPPEPAKAPAAAGPDFSRYMGTRD